MALLLGDLLGNVLALLAGDLLGNLLALLSWNLMAFLLGHLLGHLPGDVFALLNRLLGGNLLGHVLALFPGFLVTLLPGCLHLPGVAGGDGDAVTDRGRHRALRITVARLCFRVGLGLSSDQGSLGGDSKEEEGGELHVGCTGLDWIFPPDFILLFAEKYQCQMGLQYLGVGAEDI